MKELLATIFREYKERGFWKTTFILLIITVIVEIIPSGINYYIANITKNKIESLSLEVKNIQSQINQTNINLPDQSGPVLGDQTTSDTNPDGINNFNPKDWIMDNFFPNKDGYYCSTVKKFPYWNIWTTSTYSPKTTFKIRFRLVYPSNLSGAPTVSLVFGDYKSGGSPNLIYRLALFDTDLRTLRLYDSNNSVADQRWLTKDIDKSSDKDIAKLSEVLVTLSPQTQSETSRNLFVNPSITYNVAGESNSQPDTFNDIKPVVLPSVLLNDNSNRHQLGIGVNQGVCIQILSTEIK